MVLDGDRRSMTRVALWRAFDCHASNPLGLPHRSAIIRASSHITIVGLCAHVAKVSAGAHGINTVRPARCIHFLTTSNAMNSSTHSPTGVLSSLTLDDLSLRHSELAGQPPQSPCPRPRTLTASPESTPLFLKGVVSTDEDDGDLLSLRTSDEIRSISEPIEPVPDPKSIPECDEAPKSLPPSPNGEHEELRGVQFSHIHPHTSILSKDI